MLGRSAAEAQMTELEFADIQARAFYFYKREQLRGEIHDRTQTRLQKLSTPSGYRDVPDSAATPAASVSKTSGHKKAITASAVLTDPTPAPAPATATATSPATPPIKKQTPPNDAIAWTHFGSHSLTAPKFRSHKDKR